MAKLRIVLADDHEVVREGLKTLLNSEGDLEVIGEAGDGQQAIEQACALQPDLVVLDVSMPKLNGPAAATQLARECPGSKVLALTVHEDTSYLRQMLAAGAAGYVLKRSAATVLIEALRTIAAGELYVDPALIGRLVHQVGRGNALTLQPTAALSEREHAVLRRLAQGYSIKEIAAQLNLSAKTVETYKTRASEKLQLRSRAALVRYAVQQGWLGDE